MGLELKLKYKNCELKMKTKITLVLTAVSLAVLFSGCGKVPQSELEAANAAIEQAKAIGADVYVPADFVALQDSMRAVTEHVEVKKGKLFASYGTEKNQLVEITGMAAATQEKAESRKQEVKLEIETVQAEVASILAQNAELLAQAPKGKEGVAAQEAIRSENSLIETSVAEVETLVASNDLLTALDKAKAAREKSLAINTELNEVIAKYSLASKR
tara:strand:- start:85825 stop:86472 length:648 start_codon:yes stop_codon:yes gene_type:complete